MCMSGTWESPAGLKGLRVLLADDEPLVRRAIRWPLDQAGCEVIEVANGIAARDVLLERPIDLVITDYRMPEWTGGDLIRWIRSHFPSLPAVLLTGVIKDAGAVDADLILTKPIGADALIKALTELVDSCRDLLSPHLKN